MLTLIASCFANTTMYMCIEITMAYREVVIHGVVNDWLTVFWWCRNSFNFQNWPGKNIKALYNNRGLWLTLAMLLENSMQATKCATYTVVTNGKKSDLLLKMKGRLSNSCKLNRTYYGQTITNRWSRLDRCGWCACIYTIISQLSTISCTKVLCFMFFFL